MPIATVTKDVLLALSPDASAPALARRKIEREARLDADIAHTVLLLSTELVSNAVRHAGLDADEKIVVFASSHPDLVRVEVADPGQGFDPDADADGFGLRMVDKLASRWGVETASGCRVWFEVDRRRRRFDRSE